MSSRKTLLIVLIIIFSAGVTPIAIRITQNQGMPSLVIVFIRLWLVSIGLFPIVRSRYRTTLAELTSRQLLMGAFAGFWLALNLILLFLALEYTSVLVTSVLRRTTPLWIITPEIFLLGAVFSHRIWVSLGMTLIGVVLIALGSVGTLNAGSHPVWGALIAIFGALCFGVYLLIGRQLSSKIPAILYSWLVFIGAAVVTTIFMLITRTPVLGYSAAGYIWTLIVTLLAQVLGHIVINIGLQKFSATAMSIILQMGVVLSVIIAVFVFDEIPSSVQIAGSVLVIIGVVLATIEQSRRKEEHPIVSA
jgi:drug/metabolite transporter (DMT)-like permease